LQYKRFWSEEENTWIQLRVTPKGMKTINKIGLAEALKRAKANGYVA
jgi:large subunit ribosomal protein L28